MFRTVSLAALAALSLSTTAFAQAGGLLNSEFNHQANDGTYELIGGLMYGMGTAEYSKALRDADPTLKNPDLKTQAFRVRADYGFSEAMSAGVQLVYTDLDFDPGGSAVGLNDPELFFNYRMAMGAGTLRAGTSLFVAIDDSRDGNDASNQATGGITLTPYLAYEFSLYDGNVSGARVTYDLVQTDRSVKEEGATTSTPDISEGQQLGIDLYYEAKMSDMWTLGAALNWTHAPAFSQTGETGASVAGLPGGFNAMGLTVYTPVYMQSGKITILPSINHQMWDFYSQTGGLSEVTNTTIQVAGRFVF